MRHVTPAAVVALVLVCHAPTASAQGADDREAINELMWRYARALDTYNADAYVALYTEDGEFTAGGTSTKGRAALREMIQGFRDDRAPGDMSPSGLYHMTADSWTEFIDATHARHHTYWLTIAAAPGRGEGPNVIAAGRGVDELVKIGGAWLIRSRNVAPQD